MFLMMSEMNKEKFEESWALPQLNSLCEITKDIDPAANPIGFLRSISHSNLELLLMREGFAIGYDTPDQDAVINLNALGNLFNIYGVYGRMIVSRAESIDKLMLKQIREGVILKNDRRFNHYRTRDVSAIPPIPITEADNGWFKETTWKQRCVIEKTELFRLRAEVSERVEKRKTGLASILNF